MEFSLSGVEKSYGDLHVLGGVSLEVERDGILAVLGPSGCGKTTMLSMLAGLTAFDAGRIDGLVGKAIGFLFQEPRLLDWRTAAGNILFVLKDVYPAMEARRLAELYLERTGLGECRDVFPRRLSGGQRQRVAMARALAYPSRILLMDEPFKSLDLVTKIKMIEMFLDLWSAEPRTVVCVTHDIPEALLLADRIVVLTEKPATVRAAYEIDIPRNVRHLDDRALLDLECEIRRGILTTTL